MNRIASSIVFLFACGSNSGSSPTDGQVGSTDGRVAGDGAHATDGPPQHALTYTMSTITGACDTLSSPTVEPLLGLVHTTDVIALPASIPFFDETATVFAVAEQGDLQLFADSNNTNITTLVDPVSIPTADAPNGFIAPLWQFHLYFVADRSEIDLATVGQHTTVQWNDFAVGAIDADPESHVTMQAKLFGDGAIELHYCTLDPGEQPSTTVDGSSASIGIESPDGTKGVSAGFDQSGAASTGTAYRFTPM